MGLSYENDEEGGVKLDFEERDWSKSFLLGIATEVVRKVNNWVGRAPRQQKEF